METIFSRAEGSDGMQMVGSIVDLVAELTCNLKPGESVELSSSAMSGLSNVLMMAGEALGAAALELERRDVPAKDQAADISEGKRKRLKAI